MKNLYDQFETDPAIEKSGVWIEYGVGTDEEPAPRFLIARAGGANLAFQKMMEAKAKPIRRQLQNDLVETAQLQALEREVFAQTVVLSWQNVTDRQGNPIVFSKNAVVQLFKELPDLFQDIREQANRAALYRKHIQEIDAGNSQRS